MLFSEFKVWILGAVKSFTVWLGVILFGLPDIWPLIASDVSAILGEDASSKMTRIMGILVILFRMKTSQSLPIKGGKV